MNPVSTFRPDLFSGRSVVVTGGTSGIGLEIAVRFATLGADVLALGSRPEPPAKPHPRLAFATADVRSRSDLEAALAAQARIDVLVTAAGTSRMSQEWEEENFVDILDINLVGTLRTVEVALERLLRARGAIITLGSMLSYSGSAELPAYTTSKTGLLGLTRALADRLGPDGVRVNCVAPGYVRTAMTRRLQGDAQRAEAMTAQTALRRWGLPTDVADAVVFLASPAAAYVTGATLPVDGGFLAVSPV